MGNPVQVKRKHFRFPAYDDEVGVKLSSGSKRRLFADEPLLTQRTDMSVDSVPEMVPQNAYQPQQAAPKPAVEKKSAAEAVLKQTHTKEQIDELKRHKLNLPDYTTNRSRTIEKPKKPNLFGNMHKKSKETFEEATFGRRSTGRQITSFSSSKQPERSYFVPTYVPASVIPDETPAAEEVTEQELLAAMKKDKSSYILIDHEDTQFREKKVDDPSVQKFNVPKENPDIPLTRRQYQQIRPNMSRFDQDSEANDLPRYRSELKTAKEQAKNQTAYAQKVSEEEQQKKGILDKSLSGIIEDSHAEMENTKYFT
ncbi:hypothetical protein [Enterococcus sp. LJL51]|uniref:hypothetical protein n=1 Tax=Enterococcus sp. LJL51 TaxID=3416656 RepID=UPI003CEF7E37